MKSKYLFSLLTTLLLISSAYCQDSSQRPVKKKKEWNTFLDLGVGISRHKIRDESTSPLRYSGRLWNLSGSYIQENNNRFWRLYGGFSSGNIRKTVSGSTFLATSYNGFGGMSVLFGLKNQSEKKIKMFVGGDAMWTGDFRINFNFQNASYNYNLTTGIGPSFLTQYHFGWNAKKSKLGFIKWKRKERHLKLSYQVSLPLFYHFIRPDYSVIKDFTNGETGASGFDNPQISFIGDVIKFNMRTELFYYFENGNGIKLGYMWDFAKVKDDFFVVDASQHIYTIALLVRLSPLIDPNK